MAKRLNFELNISLNISTCERDGAWNQAVPHSAAWQSQYFYREYGGSRRLWCCETEKKAAILAIVELNDENTATSKERKTRDWLCKREENGLCSNLVKELSIEDITGFLFPFLADSILFVTSSYL